MRKTLLISVLLCVISLFAGAAAVFLADFGAPVEVFIILLLWLSTLGLPTTCAVLLIAGIWSGVSLGAFLGTATVTAFLFQFGGVWATRKAWSRLRARRPE